MAPFADLHRHLDGSLRASTLQELAARARVEVPHDLPFRAGMGLADALARFDFTLKLLQSPAAVKRVASEICEDAAKDGVTTLEIRFAPQLHVREGATMEAISDAAVEGAAGRAGIIFCGLYGDAPELIAQLVGIAAPRPGVVGLDLAGGPNPTQRWNLTDYTQAFRHAADLGLGRTVHAGEGRPPSEIATAIRELRAQRIGHGCTILDDPRAVELAIERGVTLEACPTSNVHTGVFRSVDEHPLPRWLDAGLRVCVNTDNTLLSQTTSSQEHDRVSRISGMTAEKLQTAVAFGHAAAFRRS